MASQARYQVRSWVEVEDWGPIPVLWFVTGRRAGAPYAEAIRGYDGLSDRRREQSERAADELFDHREAAALRDWLDRHMDMDAEILEVPLPLDAAELAKGALTPGQSKDFLQLFRVEGYDLDFTVWGWYELQYHRDLSRGGVEARVLN